MAAKSLEGRKAWVTGGATGMGRECALALAGLGADVAVSSLPVSEKGTLLPEQNAYTLTDEELEKTRAEIAARGVKAKALGFNITKNESVQATFDAIVKDFGRIDILVNAAGHSGRAYMANHPDALWHAILDVCLTGHFRTIKRCLPGMIEGKWGRIVNFASTAANVGAVAHGAYCAAKSGVLGLTRCVALEGAPHGVSCNAINPGFVATPQSKIASVQQMKIEGKVMSYEEYYEKERLNIPQQRWIPASEVGALVAFLCGDDAFGITGQDITIAGGSMW
ncbi:MAG: SDR family oxidoreductase [Alphaproteobacteria bacterium]|nr:SDR family oxidoreductase [Alphaproteobacteria bacterium]